MHNSIVTRMKTAELIECQSDPRITIVNTRIDITVELANVPRGTLSF